MVEIREVSKLDSLAKYSSQLMMMSRMLQMGLTHKLRRFYVDILIIAAQSSEQLFDMEWHLSSRAPQLKAQKCCQCKNSFA